MNWRSFILAENRIIWCRGDGIEQFLAPFTFPLDGIDSGGPMTPLARWRLASEVLRRHR